MIYKAFVSEKSPMFTEETLDFLIFKDLFLPIFSRLPCDHSRRQRRDVAGCLQAAFILFAQPQHLHDSGVYVGFLGAATFLQQNSQKTVQKICIISYVLNAGCRLSLLLNVKSDLAEDYGTRRSSSSVLVSQSRN